MSAWLFPPRCLVCAEPGVAGRDLCAACNAGLPWPVASCRRCALPLAVADDDQRCGACRQRDSPLNEVRAAFIYAAPVDGLLRRFKFHQDLAAGRLLAGLMCTRLADVERPVALVPVPLHVSRLRQRGYDQALELARPLSRGLGVPLWHGLQRVRATAPQSELDAAARHRNLRSAFAVQAPVPAHVVLVDDVMTTGATLHAAATTLRSAGVARVDAWVCARVP
ncbi:ComF family protein [Stenotrophomonas sp. Iso1]|uniref:ComF family protein n=1 Tax=Stenotrophomonas sp. Iso1 TaxID=2977283 RepID=UPI0022B78F67|nr:ComF family protein [Stenotrophomonas sp. Iso1]